MYIGSGILVMLLFVALLSLSRAPKEIQYGVTFTKLYADELRIDWKAAYLALLDDLQVRKLRLAAHWPMIEPERDSFNFESLDYQITEAEQRDAEVILSVGRRLPRWPECHVPQWAKELPWEEQKKEIRAQITEVVERYKDSPAIIYWQVENEPYLALFATQECGPLDEAFLHEEIALVRSLDPSRQILVTDSGNLGLWYKPYRAGDAFGTSLYMYFWNEEFGQFKTRLPAAFYRAKANLMRLLFGNKPTLLIELSAEPWLVVHTSEAPLETQLSRMDVEKFKSIIAYAERTNFREQYLWGVEWWYYMREKGHPEFWSFAQTLFQK